MFYISATDPQAFRQTSKAQMRSNCNICVVSGVLKLRSHNSDTKTKGEKGNQWEAQGQGHGAQSLMHHYFISRFSPEVTLVFNFSLSLPIQVALERTAPPPKLAGAFMKSGVSEVGRLSGMGVTSQGAPFLGSKLLCLLSISSS